jgi:tetratricopeptide (TPR) repeat protein
LVKVSEAAAANNLEEVVRLTELIPEDPAGAMIRLQVTNNSKDYRAVTEFGDKVAELQTDDEMKSNAYFLLGAAYQNLDNKAKAIEAFRKVTAGANASQARTLITELSK